LYLSEDGTAWRTGLEAAIVRLRDNFRLDEEALRPTVFLAVRFGLRATERFTPGFPAAAALCLTAAGAPDTSANRITKQAQDLIT